MGQALKRTTHRNSKGVPDRRVSDGIERATYTVAELCRLLGRNRVGIYDDLNAGRIPSRRLGNRFIISRAAIAKWLEGSDAQIA